MPIEHPIIRGLTQADKNASIQQILRSITRRIARRATVYIPPVPLFINCSTVGEDKVIGKIIIPFGGTLKNLFVRIGEMFTSRVVISMILNSEVAETKVNFTISNKAEKVLVEMEVDAGTMIQLILEEGSFSDGMFATAIFPEMDAHKAEMLLLKEEENAIQETEKE